MWNLLPLLAATAVAFAVIRRFRLAKERRERARDIEAVEEVFLRAGQEFSLAIAAELVDAIRSSRRIRIRLISSEVKRLEVALEKTTHWGDMADPEQERKAVRDGMVQLYGKWREIRNSL